MHSIVYPNGSWIYKKVLDMKIKNYNIWYMISAKVVHYNITWHNWDNRQIVGWVNGVKAGDFIRARLRSGRLASFYINKINYEKSQSLADNTNMFFGTVEDVGYLDDNQLTNLEKDYIRNKM